MTRPLSTDIDLSGVIRPNIPARVGDCAGEPIQDIPQSRMEYFRAVKNWLGDAQTRAQAANEMAGSTASEEQIAEVPTCPFR